MSFFKKVLPLAVVLLFVSCNKQSYQSNRIKARIGLVDSTQFDNYYFDYYFAPLDSLIRTPPDPVDTIVYKRN